jgi:hypothetical protein
MTDNVKQRLIIFVGLVALVMVLIASSLSKMQLQPGLPAPRLEGEMLVAQPVETFPAVQITISAFFRVALVVLIIPLLLVIAYRIFKEFRRKNIRWKEPIYTFLSITLFILAFMGILALLVSLLPATNDLPTALPIITLQPEVTVPLDTPPPLLKWLVGIVLTIIVTLGVAWFINQRKRSNAGLSPIELEAEKARQELLAGRDLKDVVLRCYQQMSLNLQEEEGITREVFMTTGEFESILAARGFPFAPVHQLTRLFEYVRYGRWQPNKDDELQALECLTAILKHSREKRQPSK